MTLEQNTAPIAYFAFNRPEHTLRSLTAIKDSSLSKVSEIYIFCDGPRENETLESQRDIEAVRSVAQSEQWCREVHLNFSETNKGVFNSITEGVTDVVNKHGRIIVVEDDIVMYPAFLPFMNEALEMYQNDEEVMHISAFSPLGDPSLITESSYFYNHTFTWGWATWKRAWQHYNPDALDLFEQIDRSGKRAYINLDQNFEIYWGLRYIHEKKFDDWNYNWHATVALRNGLTLQSARSLADNIGFDGSGMHCTPAMAPEHSLNREVISEIRLTKIPLKEDERIRSILHKRPFVQKALFLLKHYLRFVLIGKVPNG